MRRVSLPRRAAAALAVVACLGACEPISSSAPVLTIRFQERAPLTRDRLVVTVADGRNEWYYEGMDLQAAGDGWLSGRPLRLRQAGPVRVLVAFRGEGPHPVATADMVFPTASRQRWRLDIFASEGGRDPACAGCTGIARFTIAEGSRPSARDWLYLRWTVTEPHPTAAP